VICPSESKLLIQTLPFSTSTVFDENIFLQIVDTDEEDEEDTLEAAAAGTAKDIANNFILDSNDDSKEEEDDYDYDADFPDGNSIGIAGSAAGSAATVTMAKEVANNGSQSNESSSPLPSSPAERQRSAGRTCRNTRRNK
jgi:hypothetical protein